MRNLLVKGLATVGGIGYLPRAGGTVASFVALVAALACGDRPRLYLSLGLSACLLGLWVSREAVRIWQNPDPHTVVWDEICGMWIAVWGIAHSVTWGIAGFLLFRLFDIWKPPPIRWIEQHTGWAGILLDDLAAGCYARIVLGLLLGMVGTR